MMYFFLRCSGGFGVAPSPSRWCLGTYLCRRRTKEMLSAPCPSPQARRRCSEKIPVCSEERERVMRLASVGGESWAASERLVGEWVRAISLVAAALHRRYGPLGVQPDGLARLPAHPSQQRPTERLDRLRGGCGGARSVSQSSGWWRRGRMVATIDGVEIRQRLHHLFGPVIWCDQIDDMQGALARCAVRRVATSQTAGRCM